MTNSKQSLRKLLESVPDDVRERIHNRAVAETLNANALPRLFTDRRKFITHNSLDINICSSPKVEGITPDLRAHLQQEWAERRKRAVRVDPNFPKMEAI